MSTMEQLAGGYICRCGAFVKWNAQHVCVVTVVAQGLAPR